MTLKPLFVIAIALLLGVSVYGQQNFGQRLQHSCGHDHVQKKLSLSGFETMYRKVLADKVENGEMSASDARKRIETRRKRMEGKRSTSWDVFFVHNTNGLTPPSLAAAQTTLNNCANLSASCQIILNGVNETTPHIQQWSTSGDIVINWGDLLNLAIANDWDLDYDIIVGFTNQSFTPYAGFAELGNCGGPPVEGFVTVMTHIAPASVFAHEVGHCLGLIHDNVTNSLMGASVPWNPDTMGFDNRSCVSTSAACAPLPVTWLSVTAEMRNKQVIVSWSTASEINNDFFTVERSSDGRAFDAVGTVKGAGSSQIAIEYTYTDTNPLSGVNYYRIKQTDFDGQYAYSAMVSTEYHIDDVLVATSSEGIIIRSTKAAGITIFDAQGRLVYHSDNLSDAVIPVVNTGLYFVQVGGTTHKVVVNI